MVMESRAQAKARSGGAPCDLRVPTKVRFVARSGDSAGLRGARFQADSARSGSAEIGWNLWGKLPQLLPQTEPRTLAESRSRAVQGVAKRREPEVPSDA